MAKPESVSKRIFWHSADFLPDRHASSTMSPKAVSRRRARPMPTTLMLVGKPAPSLPLSETWKRRETIKICLALFVFKEIAFVIR